MSVVVITVNVVVLLSVVPTVSVIVPTASVIVLLSVVPTVSVVSCAVLMKAMMNVVAMGSSINLVSRLRLSSLLRMVLPTISLMLVNLLLLEMLLVLNVRMNADVVWLVSTVIA